MEWLFIDPFSLGYPTDWTPISLTICVSLTHTGTLGDAISLRAKEFAGNTVRFLIRKKGGDATSLTDTCFSDSASIPFPSDDALEPFSDNAWLPEESVNDLLLNGLGTSTYSAKFGVGAHFFQNVGGSGQFMGMSATICYQSPPEPPHMPISSPPPPWSPPPYPPPVAPNWQSWAWFNYNTSTPCTRSALHAGLAECSTGPIPEPCDPNDNHQCFGNGLCVNNVCRCFIGWRGTYCSQLDLLPASPDTFGLPMDGNMPTWGGSAVFENGTWSLVTGCKLFNTTLTFPSYREWTSLNSSIAPSPNRWGRRPPYNYTALAEGGDPYGASYMWQFTTDRDPYNNDQYGPSYLMAMKSEGSDPAGPYHKVGVVHKAFRADFKRRYTAKEGEALFLLTIGRAVDAFGNIQPGGRGMLIKHSQSGSVLGPWQEKVVYAFDANGHNNASNDPNRTAYDFDCDIKDPSFVIHENGTTVIAYRGVRCAGHDHTESVALLVAPQWNATYTRVGVPIFIDHEDLFMWIDARGTHMIMHSQLIDHGTVRGSSSTAGADHKKKRGGYAFSADGLKRWSLSTWELFPSEIQWANGTVQQLLKQQRPSLIFDPITNEPTHLITGVDYLYDPCCQWYIYGSGWTLVQPLANKCHAGWVEEAGGCRECLSSQVGCGRCLQATSKYGSCVCSLCQAGWQGDNCDKPTYECLTGSDGHGFLSRKHCDDAGNDRVTLIESSQQPTMEQCAVACTKFANQWQVEGCCYNFQGTNKVCYFNPQKQILSNNGMVRFASLCARRNDSSTCSAFPPSPSPPTTRLFASAKALTLPPPLPQPPSQPPLPPPPLPPGCPPCGDGGSTLPLRTALFGSLPHSVLHLTHKEKTHFSGGSTTNCQCV